MAQLSNEYRVLVDLLRELREANGLKQEELAKLLKKDQPFVSKYERRERRLDFTEVRDIVLALNLTLAEFVDLYEKRLMIRS